MIKTTVLACLLFAAAGIASAAAPSSATISSSVQNVCVSTRALTVDPNKVKALVTALIDNPSLTATNINFIGNCTCAVYGTVTGAHALTDTFSGKPVVVFTSGNGSQALVNKNTQTGFSGMPRMNPNNGDPDITAAATEYWPEDYPSDPFSKDACGVTFTLTASKTIKANSFIKWSYVFGSEEYPAFTEATKHDYFGFFMDAGSAKQRNIALIYTGIGEGLDEDSEDFEPVCIDTINDHLNNEFFIANYDKTSNIEYNGYTTLLNTRNYAIAADQSVPIKVVIADVGDNRMDSAVYLRSPIALCGDGIVQFGEECDDANNVNDDMCTNQCTLPKCGDGILTNVAGEQCEKSLLPADQQCSCSKWCQNLPHGCGDPHILSFDGADFMFVGWADATFNMMSHSSYQINTYFRKYPKQDPTKTWIGALGMKVGSTGKIEVTGAGKGKMIVKVNDEELALNSDSVHEEFTVQYKGEVDGDKEVMIITPDMVIGVSIDSYNWNLDFEVEKISLDMGDMHGILGQSYKRMLEQKSAISQGRTAARPVSGVEGEETDYNVPSGLFGDDFKFNKFQGVDVAFDGARAISSGATSARKALEESHVVAHAGYY